MNGMCRGSGKGNKFSGNLIGQTPTKSREMEEGGERETDIGAIFCTYVTSSASLVFSWVTSFAVKSLATIGHG